MSIFIKRSDLKVKTPTTGTYQGQSLFTENDTQTQINRINSAGTTQVNAVNAKGQETLASIPDDYTELSNDVDDLKSALYPNNAFDVLAYNSIATNGTDKYVTFTFSGNSCAVSGTASGNAVKTIYSNTSKLPYGFVAGRSYAFKYSTGDNNVRLAMFFRDSNNANISGTSQYLTADTVVPIPSNAVGMIIRVDVQSNATVDTTVTFSCLSADTNYDLTQKVNRAIKGEERSYYQTTGLLDLNGMLDDHIWLVDDSHTFVNKPDGMTSGFVMVTHTSNFHLQLAWQFSGGKMWKRRGDATGSVWEDWKLVSGDAGTVNNYYFDTNENTYNIESTPTITSDTNNYLASTGDTTDRTSDIATMLTANKVCNLGAGVFYVKDLEMPSGTAIKGSGYNTKIIMASGDGCAIQMASFCSISDCSVCGSASSISVPSEIGSRNGILWSGDFTETSDSTIQPMMGLISNVRILDFTGGAIVCQDTGTGTYNQLQVVNLFTNHCGVGIYIPYYSEYHKFTNVRTVGGLYGCINNGGNNIFVNCDFSTCKNGLLMDNSSNQSPNNSHGSMFGCVFNHINSNTGIAIKILNCDHGFVFDGCQIFYGQIDIEDSDGIVISNCNFGPTNNNITIKNGGAVLFANNMHKAQPTISITNNANVHFVNCYVGDTGATVAPA